jgi:beta-carotene/zeaxanthin 4-ketolase
LKGLLVSIGIFSGWLLSLLFVLPLHCSSIPTMWLILLILERTFLHTGLFIIAHDAMHGSLIPESRSWNNIVGHISVWCYGFLSYDHCYANHHQHHAHPGQVGDPDFHDGYSTHPIAWYLKFLGEYLPLPRVVGFLGYWALTYFCLHQSFQVSFINFGVFCVFPFILSSVQLFYFGTYLPHRDRLSQNNLNCIQSVDCPVWLSFLSCYHFGYHRAHHESPHTPWYELPSVHRMGFLTIAKEASSVNRRL